METPKESWQAFERSWARNIIASINFIREQDGITVKQLGARLHQIGWPISDATLSGILSGDKRGSLNVTEWLAFSRVLNVSPAFLLLGLPSTDSPPQNAVWEKTAPDSFEVYDWISHGSLTSRFYPRGLTSEQFETEYKASMNANRVLNFMHSINGYYGAIKWLAAQIVVAAEYPRNEIESALPASVLSQDSLWDDLTSLKKTILEMREQPSPWQISPTKIPAPLVDFLLEDATDRIEIPISILKSWISDDDLEEAQFHIKHFVEEAKKNKPQLHNHGQKSLKLSENGQTP